MAYFGIIEERWEIWNEMRMKWEGKGTIKVVRKGTFEEQEIDRRRWVEGDGGEF